ncbi:MAG: hypothetical protein JWN36_811 [Microbacteriaceae bacterium]|nr:hypothetical protein [Microbacteriaceae bacterium]
MTRRFGGGVVAVAVAMLCGCTTAAPPTTDHPDKAASTIVVAQKRDITSVVVVEGTVSANPLFLVPAGNAGAVKTPAAAPGQSAGSTILAVGGAAVTLPAPGLVARLLVSDGQVVAAGVPVAEVAYSGFGIVVRTPPQVLYRMYAAPILGKANVQAGPSGVDCTLAPVAQDVPTEGGSSASDEGYPSAVCLLPVGSAVVAGLPARVGVQTATKSEVLALPVSAVSGSTQHGQVVVVAKGTSRLVDVGLGISDGAYVEITSGLAAGEAVRPYAPGVQG